MHLRFPLTSLVAMTAFIPVLALADESRCINACGQKALIAIQDCKSRHEVGSYEYKKCVSGPGPSSSALWDFEYCASKCKVPMQWNADEARACRDSCEDMGVELSRACSAVKKTYDQGLCRNQSSDDVSHCKIVRCKTRL